MVRLTAELIHSSPSYLNPIRERELDLRGNKIPVIENLGASEDQYDTIDMSDNEIRKLENFPNLPRLSSLLLSNNRVTKIAKSLEESIPNLQTLILTGNNVANLSDIDPLSTLPKLNCLSLLENPITKRAHYRYYVVHKLRTVRLLDFKKVKPKEREEADKFFAGEIGVRVIQKDQKETASFDISPSLEQQKQTALAIKTAIEKATTEEEVIRLEAALKEGRVPSGPESLDTPSAMETN
eukprot:TRINITY_DN312_c0_g1_i1.p1 TRINITY_DN312_c0_g1~~TRINITY_DN312_c0_g1_i1.p1  ORF type:complete len:239 (-),score=36.02 TRINITY_DN312_c0_g1_i1:284-1000(-)